MEDGPVLTREEQEIFERVVRFGREEVERHAAAWERERRFPLDALRRAAALGLTGIEVPKALGGLGGSFLLKTRIAEELARHSMGFAFSLINTQNVATRIALQGAEELRRRFLPALLAGERIGATSLTEPGAGSDFPAITTTARRGAEGWVLDGEKSWLTNAAAADVILVYAQTEPGSGARGIACFLVDGQRRGFERLPPYGLMGGHAIGAGGIRLTDYVVPEGDLFQPPGEAFKRALASINGARTYVAAMCCGMVEEALRCAVSYGTQRRTFGASLIEHQGLRWSLADVATDIEAARLLTWRAARLIAAGEDAMLAAAHAKKFAARMAVARISDCMQAMGAAGLRDDLPFGRHLAGARIAHYVDGTTEMQNERIGATLAKTYGAR